MASTQSISLRRTRLSWALLGTVTLLAIPVAAQKRDDAARARDAAMATLEQEIRSLEARKTEKLEALERAEAARWDSRYRQTGEAREEEGKARALETKYSRLAEEFARQQDEAIKAAALTQEKERESQDVRARENGFAMQVRQGAEETSEKLSQDTPIDIEKRAMLLSRATELLAEEQPEGAAGAKDGLQGKTSGIVPGRLPPALEAYFDALMLRHRLTLEQRLESRLSLFDQASGAREAEVWRLRLGTVFAAELEKEGAGEIQLLMHTGNLQGQTHVWRSGLPAAESRRVADAVRGAASGKQRVEVPLNLLQSRSLAESLNPSMAGQQGLKAFLAWFRSGGLVMYPLFFTALFALLLSSERMWLYTRRGTDDAAFMKRVLPLVEKGQWHEALQICARSRTTLGKALAAILNRVGHSRDSAEKSVREAMLGEMPVLEKRLSFIAALGAAAPLMGLLGTVSGIITLFKVLNETGTNDPKILAGGISEALVTTMAGLIIAIPVLLIHGFLRENLDGIVAAVNGRSLELLNRIWPDEEKGTGKN